MNGSRNTFGLCTHIQTLVRVVVPQSYTTMPKGPMVRFVEMLLTNMKWRNILLTSHFRALFIQIFRLLSLHSFMPTLTFSKMWSLRFVLYLLSVDYWVLNGGRLLFLSMFFSTEICLDNMLIMRGNVIRNENCQLPSIGMEKTCRKWISWSSRFLFLC